MSNDNAKQFRARLRKEAQAINERNRVPGDLYYKESAPPPEQSAPEGDGGLICKSHGLAVLMTHVNDGKPCADYLAGGTASTDHARAALVPVLLNVLHDAMKVVADKAAGGRMLTTQNEARDVWQKYADVLAAARKARME